MVRDSQLQALLRRISEQFPGSRVFLGSKATFVLVKSSMAKKQIETLIPENYRETVIVLRH